MKLEELLGPIEERRVAGSADIEIAGIACDSRLLDPGQAFFCIKGLVTDGHLHTRDAVARGAKAVVLERYPEEELPDGVTVVRVPDSRLALALCSARFYGEPSKELILIGVTGTNGKTTTTFLVENILKKAGYMTGLIGTVENHIGDSVEPVTRTTPESLDLQRLLRRMRSSGVEVAVMEVSSHALELHRVSGCSFDAVVFTNLTQDHLDFHISLEEYYKAKRRLFEGAVLGEGRVAIVNSDDEFGRRLLEETSLPQTSFGIRRPADIRAADVEVSAAGNRFKILFKDGSMDVSTVLQGGFNVYNCLAAVAVAVQLGVDRGSIAAGVETLMGVPGRFERIDCGQPFTALVDYAHTPDGIRSLLEACREVAAGRVIIVVGCGGDRDRSKRSLMGRVGVELSDLCVITSDNPRTEDPHSIIQMMVEGVRDEYPPERYMVVADRRDAIRAAVDAARPGDLVVVAGKGHESGQIFSDRVIPFDDRQVVRESLGEVTGAQS